ncbi:MAG: HlyD family type I secretion periplasmic adaptor subunit [Pseudomonadota bacterium]|nr:HlyD family type I secretion periplasmic adaptor subunit [Pseudomonadota bacterium]
MSNTDKDQPGNAATTEDKATAEAADAIATASTATGAAGEQPGANPEQPMTGRASAEQRALEAIYLPARTQDKSELELIEKSEEPITIVRDRTVIFAFLALFIGFGGFMTWASTVKLSQGVFAQGQVAVDSQRKTVQHLEGGIIESIFVREGDMVEFGQQLIVLQDVQSRSRQDQMIKRLGVLSATLDRLKAEQVEDGNLVFNSLTDLGLSAGDEKEVLQQQQTLYLDRLDQLSGAKQMLITRIARFEEDISGRLAQIRALEAQRSINQEELRNLRGLLADNLTQRDKVVAKELSLSETDFQIAQQRSAIGQLNVQIEEAKAESLQLDRDRRREISEEIAKTQNAILEIEEELLGLRDVVSRTQITAPQKGRVLNLSCATLGGVIPPSEPIMQIVPDGDELVVEAQLRTIDRDSISKGAEVNARFTAFPTRSTPELIGLVDSISADVVTDPNSGTPYYNLRVIFTPEEYARLNAALAEQARTDESRRTLSLTPGMPVDIFVDNGEPKRPIEIFFEPLEEVLDRALRGS